MPVDYVSSDAIADPISDLQIEFANVNAGAGNTLLVLASMEVAFTGDILSGVTFGATALTELLQFNAFDGVNSTEPIAAFYLLSPVGIDTLTVTFSSASTIKEAAYYVLSGVNQVVPFGTPLTKYSPETGPQINSTVESSDGGLVVDCATPGAARQSTMAVDSTNQIQRHVVSTTSSTLGTSTKVGSATVFMKWIWSPGTGRRNHVLIPVNAADADHRRLIIGGLCVAATDGDVVTQDADYGSVVNQAKTTGGTAGSDRIAFVGTRIITDVETNDYAPTLSSERFWVAGIAAYKADTTGGGTTPAPEITSVLVAETTEGAPFFYQIEATNGAYLYSASPLPAGLSVDENGDITGMTAPGTANTYHIILGATNDTGTGSATLVLTVHPSSPIPPGGTHKVRPLPIAVQLAIGQAQISARTGHKDRN